MSILDIKDVEAYDQDVVKFLRFYEFPGQTINFEGSAKYEKLKYKSDYDIILFIKNTTPANEVFNNLRKVLENIQKEPNTYFTELKMQTKDKNKFRWFHQDVLSMSDFAEHYNDNLAFFKVDMVIHVKDKFFETSCTYRMVPVMGMSLDKLIKELKEDIQTHQKEGNYYKCLKIMFSIYVIYKNMSQIEYLVDIFNSELGKIYETICILEAVELVHENYKDERTIQKIEKCLNLLNKEFDLKAIAKKIDEYRKIVNKHARTIFINLKDGKYP